MLLGSSTWAARMWGVSASSPLWEAASQFLSIRAVGAPVTVLLLVMQVNMGDCTPSSILLGLQWLDG
jgi:hypothetical protein